jgi:hypothetical protein
MARPAQPLMSSILDSAPGIDGYTQHDLKPFSNPLTFAANPYVPQPGMYGEAYEPYPRAFAWSPSCAAPGVQMGYRAPLLHPRLVQLPDRPITPHDTYRYPNSHVEQIYVAPVEAPSKDDINMAFSYWYAEQVVGILVKPGLFRAGVGGQSEEMWGLGGRERDAWLRVGRSPPDYSKPWGRMGMTATPAPAPRKPRVRRPETERQDPYNVLWKHESKAGPALVSFIQDMLQRMTISPSAVVAAVWFLTGLGFHEGDPKGAELRKLFDESYRSDPQSMAVEKRVALLGLLLAGKWLDDNSFLTKSWTEVTSIPVVQIDLMERAALQDLHYSLYIPVSAWVDHVNEIWTSFYAKGDLLDPLERIVSNIVSDMVNEARDVEIKASPDIRPLSLGVVAAGDQAISRDWGTFVREYTIESRNLSPSRTNAYDVDEEMLDAARIVSALVDEDEYEEEEEFLDYDGAKRWLPSPSELRRTRSNSSSRSDAVDAWRSTVSPIKSKPVAFETQPYDVTRTYIPVPAQVASTPEHCSTCMCDRQGEKTFGSSSVVTSPILKEDGFKETGIFLEPGISVIRPTTRDFSNYSDCAHDVLRAQWWASSQWQPW